MEISTQSPSNLFGNGLKLENSATVAYVSEVRENFHVKQCMMLHSKLSALT